MESGVQGVIAYIGLQMKVSKLKKDRCLDAQRLEEYYSKQQQLKENQKSLQDTIKVLEDRLRAGLCDRCAVTEEHMRKKQQAYENILQENMKLIKELMNTNSSLQDDNKKLLEQLRQLRLQVEGNYHETAEKQLDADDGIIPDSPVHSFSIPLTSRMRRKREHRNIRYVEHVEADLEQTESTNDFGKLVQSSTQIPNSKAEDILVADTCDQDLPIVTNQLDNYPSEKPTFNLAAVVAETLGLGVQEDSDSESILPTARSSPAVMQIPQNQIDGDLRAPLNQESSRSNGINFGCSDSSPEVQDGVEWANEGTSPVFGAPAVSRGSPELDTCSSQSLLGPGRNVNVKSHPLHITTDFRTQKVRSKSDDVSLVVPLQFVEEVKSVVRQSSTKHMVLKRSTSELVSCTSPSKEELTDRDSVFMLPKRQGGRGEKRKKEDGEYGHIIESMVNKENYFLLNMDPNGDRSVDKPLDLSDRFSDVRSKDRNHTRESFKSKLKQMTPYDALRPASKVSSAVLTKTLNGNCKGNSHFTADPSADEVTQLPIGEATSVEKAQFQDGDRYDVRLPNLSKGLKDSQQLYDELKVNMKHRLARKRSKAERKECEPPTVLQPNPRAASPPSESLESKQGKRSLEMQWSLDPGADLSQYKMDVTLIDRKTPTKSEREDVDYTFVSDSMLLKLKKEEQVKQENAKHEGNTNDNLEEMFDRTAYGDFESCVEAENPENIHCPDREDTEEEGHDRAFSHAENDKSDKLEEKRDKTKQRAFVEPYFQNDERKKGCLNFPHIEVVRNKEERRKMLGHVCKECEMYYADLPEEEREQKLASCSRHRFHYIPPNTPENFWEVGFPTTQTCMERGYIKEELSPCHRPRRRQPYSARFSPKGKEQKT